jgi:hypothetical protein
LAWCDWGSREISQILAIATHPEHQSLGEFKCRKNTDPVGRACLFFDPTMSYKALFRKKKVELK